MALVSADQSTVEVELNLKTKPIFEVESLGVKVLTLLLFLFSQFVIAQEATTSSFITLKNQIKFNPVIMLFPAWNLSVERFIREDKSFQVDFCYLDQANFIDTRLDGQVINLDYKKYFIKKRNRRGYIMPYIRYQNVKFAQDGDIIRISQVGGGVALGRVFYLNEWLVADFSLGVNYIPTDYKTLEKVGTIDIEIPKTLYGFGPKIGLLIGISF